MFDSTAESKVKEILERLVAFDTTSTLPNRACIDFIRDYLARYGITGEIIASDDGSKACLWATIGASDKPGIVLAGHSDVVPVAGQEWSSDPFMLTEREGKLYGRGSCDMKAFIACVLAMVPELVKHNLAQPIHLAFTHDEETDMSGAIRLADFMRAREIKPEWVWIGEPTSLRIIDQHKGVAAYQTTITGVPGHSGQPDLGLNAIDLGGDFLSILSRVRQAKKNSPYRPSRFDPPYTTLNSGVVSGGTAENIIAEHWNLLWQIRAHPGDTASATLADIEVAAAREIAPRFKPFPHAGMKTCTCFDIPPLMPTADNPGHKILGQITGNSETQAVSFATEAGFFQKLGTHVVVCGPGNIDHAHKADEYVEVSQLISCIDLIRKVALLRANALFHAPPVGKPLTL